MAEPANGSFVMLCLFAIRLTNPGVRLMMESVVIAAAFSVSDPLLSLRVAGALAYASVKT